MSRLALRARVRALAACAAAAGLGLAGCTGPDHPAPDLELTATSTDAAAPVGVGETATVTFTLANPSTQAVDKVTVSSGGPGMQLVGMTCVASSGSCPTGTASPSTAFDMPAGAHFTFTVRARLGVDGEGPITMHFDANSATRSGFIDQTAQVNALDRRDGLYEVFTATGRRTNADVQFKSAAMTFSVSTGSADKTMIATSPGFTFPSGARFISGPDILAGQADFGTGRETFIAARNLVTALSDLDGKTFSVFGVARPTTAAASSSVQAIAIAGSTMEVCADAAPHAIATCPAASLRHYVLSAGDGPVFTATDAADADTFTFQVARSADSLIYLRADQSDSGSVFAAGFADPAATTAEILPYGDVAGPFGALDLLPDHVSFFAWGALLAPLPPLVALAPPADGPAGLVQGTRASDNALELILQQGALVLVSATAGEFDVLVH